MNEHARFLSALIGDAWAMRRVDLDAMLMSLKANAAPMGEAEAAVLAQRMRVASKASTGAVAVLPLYGTIMQRGSYWGASVQQFTGQFRAAVNDPAVKAIVIDVDSPGGTVAGCDELTTEMFKARGKGKKIVAVANSLMASAAYYIASAATEIVASPSSTTGSIGVYAALADYSEMLAMAGVKYTIVTHGENKAAGDPRQPTSQSAIDELQASVTAFGQMFDKAVARNRGKTVGQVRETFGQGKTFMASDAKAIGMVDRVATLDDVLAEFGIEPLSLGLAASADPAIAALTGALGAVAEDDAAERARKARHRARALQLGVA